jgi:hypothetical protein
MRYMVEKNASYSYKKLNISMPGHIVVVPVETEMGALQPKDPTVK